MTPDEVLDVARRGAAPAAARRCSPSATVPRTAGPRRASGCRATGTTRPSTTSARWPSGSSRRPACCRTSTRASCPGTSSPGSSPSRASMGMMLETTSTRLFTEPGGRALRQPRQGSRRPPARPRGRGTPGDPVHDRHPRRASARRWPSGPTRSSRSAAWLARTGTCKRSSSRTSGPSRTPRCARRPDADSEDYLATVAVARLVLGPKVRIQVPPNLSAPEVVGRAARRRRRRLGRRQSR